MDQVLAKRSQHIGEPAQQLTGQVTKELHAIEYWPAAGTAPRTPTPDDNNGYPSACADCS